MPGAVLSRGPATLSTSAPLARSHVNHRATTVAVAARSTTQQRLAERLRRVNRRSGAAGRGAAREDERGVGVADVPARALGVLRRRRFAERIARGDRPVLGASSERAPPADGDARRKGRVERGTVHPGLSARMNDGRLPCHAMARESWQTAGAVAGNTLSG